MAFGLAVFFGSGPLANSIVRILSQSVLPRRMSVPPGLSENAGLGYFKILGIVVGLLFLLVGALIMNAPPSPGHHRQGF